MTKQQLTLHPYLGYVGSIEHDKECDIFFGKVLFIQDTICYESKTLEDLQAAFECAVDQYKESCKELNRQPNTTCKGSFNVRIPQGLHHDLVCYSLKHNQSLNKTMTLAAKEFLNNQCIKVQNKPSAIGVLSDFFGKVPSFYSEF